jgi:Holliday junction resolvasome RuvABC endonuclease subunit
MSLNQLALDLGTTTGFCLGSQPGCLISGTWNLKPGRYDGGGMRFVKFRARLQEIHDSSPVGAVYFEEVRRHAGTDAAHVYGGLMAVLQEWCEGHKIPYAGVPVGSIKKHATGKGNAGKPEMIAAMRELGFEPTDDNQADAIALWLLKHEEGA